MIFEHTPHPDDARKLWYYCLFVRRARLRSPARDPIPPSLTVTLDLHEDDVTLVTLYAENLAAFRQRRKLKQMRLDNSVK